jgi:hypothetical protein
VSSASHALLIEDIDGRMIAVIRVIIAVAALLITYIDPFSPDRFVVGTYVMLLLYLAYSSLFSIGATRQYLRLPGTVMYWIDVGWYVILIGLSSGTNSIFFFFFFFVILASSFQYGFRVGFRVTLVSTALFMLSSLLTMPLESDFQLHRFLLRSISLLVLGYMMAYWGGSEVEAKRRLAFLKDISMLSNPRFGTAGCSRSFWSAYGSSMTLTSA